MGYTSAQGSSDLQDGLNNQVSSHGAILGLLEATRYPVVPILETEVRSVLLLIELHSRKKG